MFDFHELGILLAAIQSAPMQFFADLRLNVRRHSEILNKRGELLRQPVRHVRGLQATRQHANDIPFDQELLRLITGSSQLFTRELEGGVLNVFSRQLLRWQAIEFFATLDRKLRENFIYSHGSQD